MVIYFISKPFEPHFATTSTTDCWANCLKAFEARFAPFVQYAIGTKWVYPSKKLINPVCSLAFQFAIAEVVEEVKRR